MRVTPAGLGLLSIFALSGCTGVPSLEPGLRVSVANLVDRLQCEFHKALVAQGSRVKKINEWQAGYELTLQVDEEGALSLDSSWINPITGGTFTLGLGGGATSSASRLVSLKFTLPVKKLLRAGCDPKLPPASGFQLDSNLGLTDWLTRVLDAAQSNSFENFDSFGTNIQFKLTLTGKLTPTWELAAFKGEVVPVCETAG